MSPSSNELSIEGGLRPDVDKVDWNEVADFVGDNNFLVVPKRLVELANLKQCESCRKDA
jgi:hypothetical protein